MQKKPTTTKGDPKGTTRLGLERLAIVKAEGNVDRAGIEACDYLITRAGQDTKGAVVDLTQATHVDYRATVILVARRRVLKARGGELAIAAGSRSVRDIIRASAGSELQVFPTVDEALAYVRGDSELTVVAGKRSAEQKR
jgi:anti-anti-sigma factor